MPIKPQIPPEFIEQQDIEIRYKNIDGEEKSAFWRNAFSEKLLGPNIDRFYPTETLYGDWDGEVLFLAQDALPAPLLEKYIQDFRKKGIPISETWVHADRDNPNLKNLDKSIKPGGFITNQNLRKFKEKYIGSKGALYGSAAANMLFDNGTTKMRGATGFNHPDFQEYMQSVLEWVVKSMPNLKTIFCLGKAPWEVSSSFLKLDKKDREYKKFKGGPPKRAIIGTKEIEIIASYHPTAAITKARRNESWEYLKKSLK